MRENPSNIYKSVNIITKTRRMNTKPNLKKLLTFTLILALGTIGSVTTFSQALPATQVINTPEIVEINIDSKKEIKEIISQLNKVDPQKPSITKLEKKSKGEVTSNNNNLKVSIKSDKTISMNNGRNKISLKVDNHGDNQELNIKTKLVDNKIIYEGQKVDTIVESIDGGVRQTINIKDPIAPKIYNFPMELQKDQRIVINKDGSANVLNSKNESITTILKPWAKDAIGKDIKTFYTVDRIDKNVLQQHITTNDMIKYPVKADPIWCARSYERLEWDPRQSEGGWTLKITPNWCGRQMQFSPYATNTSYTYANSWSTFQDIAWNAPWHPLWPWGHRSQYDNSSIYSSMFKQYYCHVAIAGWKPTWNIEPWRGNRPMPVVFAGVQPVGLPIPCNH